MSYRLYEMSQRRGSGGEADRTLKL